MSDAMLFFCCFSAFVLWYLYFGLIYAINGGTLGRNPYLMVFQMFWEDVLWYIPGGLKRRVEYIKKIVDGGSNEDEIYVGGRSLTAKEIRKKNLYTEVAKGTLSSPLSFWLQVVFASAFGFFIPVSFVRAYECFSKLAEMFF